MVDTTGLRIMPTPIFWKKRIIGKILLPILGQ
jgi:hypothetical protein